MFLIVEDNRYVGRLHRAMIRQVAPNSQVVLVDNALRALAQLSRHVPSAIILDIDLPSVNGIELLQIIHRTPALADVPVLVVTMLSPEELASMGGIPHRVQVISKMNANAQALDEFVRAVLYRREVRINAGPETRLPAARATRRKVVERPKPPVKRATNQVNLPSLSHELELGPEIASPAAFLDWMRVNFQCDSDKQLSEIVDISPPNLSGLRNGKRKATPEVILRFHDATNIKVADLKRVLLNEKNGAQPLRKTGALNENPETAANW